MSFITSVTNAFAKDVAYLIERAQTGCKDEKQIIKTALAAGRVFNGIVMAASVIGFVASVLTVNVGGIVSTIALFVAAYESFKFMQGREDILDNPGESFVSTVATGLIKGSVDEGMKDACARQVKGTLFKPIWVEIQMAMLRRGYNPFPITLN